MGHFFRSLLLTAGLSVWLLPQSADAQAAASKPAAKPGAKAADASAPKAAVPSTPKAADKAAPVPEKPSDKAVAKATTYMIDKIVFEGKTPYSPAALEAASGLKPGASLTNSGLQAAAERLIETGAFGDISATLDGPVKSVAVIFKVEPVDAQHMLRASFENLVWFSREELAAGVRERVPLFNGSVPEGGTLQDAVQAALQQMLAAKGVTAKVESELVAPHPGQPYRLAVYRVTAPEVRLHKLDIAGVPAVFAATTDAVVRAAIGTVYNDGLVGGLSERVLADYKNAGYLDAALSGLTTTIVSSTTAKVEVDVTARMETGEAYRLSKLEWAGSPVMSADEFNRAAKARSGELASQQAVRASVENLDAAYRDQGYMDVVLDAVPTLYPARHEVAYAVLATPGPQYKLRKLTVLNLTPEQRKDFDRGWRLKPGDVYNAGYVTSFLKSNTALLSLQKLLATYRVMEEPDSDVLDLEIAFRKDTSK